METVESSRYIHSVKDRHVLFTDLHTLREYIIHYGVFNIHTDEWYRFYRPYVPVGTIVGNTLNGMLECHPCPSHLIVYVIIVNTGTTGIVAYDVRNPVWVYGMDIAGIEYMTENDQIDFFLSMMDGVGGSDE